MWLSSSGRPRGRNIRVVKSSCVRQSTTIARPKKSRAQPFISVETSAATYDGLLMGGQYQRPAPSPDSRHVFHVYAIAVDQRDDVQRALQAAGIGTGIHYPIPVHLQKAYAGLGRQPNDLPVTESLAKRFLSLPMYAELQPEHVSAVAHALKKACAFETA